MKITTNRQKLTLDERIDIVLKDEDSKEFLVNQLSTIRDNILETERRISRMFITIISFISISELVRLKIIQKLNFFTTEIDKLDIVLIVLPCIIAYYTYSLFTQIFLRRSLFDLYSKIIKNKYPVIDEYNIDDFLITHLDNSIEAILTRKPRNLLKNVIDLVSAPFILFFQWVPIIYSYFVLLKSYGQHQTFIFWLSLAATTAFYLRATLLAAGYIKEQGGLIRITKEFIEERR